MIEGAIMVAHVHICKAAGTCLSIPLANVFLVQFKSM